MLEQLAKCEVCPFKCKVNRIEKLYWSENSI